MRFRHVLRKHKGVVLGYVQRWNRTEYVAHHYITALPQNIITQMDSFPGKYDTSLYMYTFCDISNITRI